MFVASSFGRICTAITLAMSVNTAVLALVTVPVGGMIDAPAGSVNLACDGLTVLSGGTYQVGARAARDIKRPQDLLFLDDAAYRWRADDEAAIAAYWTGNLTECYALCCSLLDEDRVPEAERARVEKNRDFCMPTAMLQV